MSLVACRNCDPVGGEGVCCYRCVPEMFPYLPEPPCVQPQYVVSDEEVLFWVAKPDGIFRDPVKVRENIARGKRLGTYDPGGSYQELRTA